MIFFTVDNDIRGNFYRAPRLTRQIFCYKNGLLLQSRLYPGNEDNIRKLYRELVQRAISQCIGAPNLWKTKMELGEIQPYWITPEESMHYRDYNNGYAALSFLGGTENYGQLVIGSQSRCVICGNVHSNRNSLRCRECSSVVVCKECGRVVPTDEAHYMEEAFFCRDCVTRCEMCGSWIRGADIHQAISRNGRIVRLCEHCHTSATGSCGLCSSREICQIINAGRFCPHVEYAAAAAA